MKRYFFLMVALFLSGCIYPMQAPDATDEPDMTATSTSRVPAENYQSLLSPDGKWQADVMIFSCAPVENEEFSYEELLLTNVDSGEMTSIAAQTISCGGLGAFGLLSLYWSPNSRYLYYTDTREGVPDGGCGFWARLTYRLDTETMTSTPIGGGYISPDGTKLATWLNRELLITDLDTGELARVPLYDPGAELIRMFWLPDMSGIVYLLADVACGPAIKSMLVHVDVITFEQTMILETSAAE